MQLRSGTATFSGGTATVSVTVWPRSHRVPLSGPVPARYSVAGRSPCPFVHNEPLRFERALRVGVRHADDVLDGDRRGGVVVLVQALGEEVPAAGQQRNTRMPIRTPSHIFRDEPSGSGGGMTCVGCRAMTCVAPASPTGSSGVASTSWPCRTRSRSAISSVGALVAVGRVLRHALHHDGVQPRRHVGVHLGRAAPATR